METNLQTRIEVVQCKEIVPLFKTTFKDQNSFDWEVSICDRGTGLRYLGQSYFKETYFYIEGEERIEIYNTGCFIFPSISTNLYIFYYVKNMICHNFTDGIWERIEQLLNS